MAKAGMAFNTDQVVSLIAGIRAIQMNMDSLMQDCDKTFKAFEGDTIMGESEQKVPIIDGIGQVRACFNAIEEKSISMATKADNVANSLGEAIQLNIKTNEEAAQLIAAAAKKVQEGPGANA